jgi:Family of unknown function (DUF5996)
VTQDEWPALPYQEWRETRDTLHMYTQVVGKIRLALSPFEPDWANVPLYVSARGLTTSPIPVGLRTIDAEFDFADHALVIRSSDGAIERRPLGGSVADFYTDVMSALRRMNVDVQISTLPSEVANPIPFPEDRTHDTYDPAHAAQFHHVLSMVDVVVKEHRAKFWGRTTPSHFFWGTFDLALARYGEPVSPPPDAGVIRRLGGDAEQICVGWWPGDERVTHPAFYAYGYPARDEFRNVSVQPSGAGLDSGTGEFVLTYDVARAQPDPRRAILDFFQSTYDGISARMGWDPAWTHTGAPALSAGRAR